MSTNIRSYGFIVDMLLHKEGKLIKIRKASFTHDEDRGTDYTTYPDTITTRALVTNVSGWVEIMFPYGRAYEGDHLLILRKDENIDTHDRILYEGKEFKISEIHDREDFLEAVIKRL